MIFLYFASLIGSCLSGYSIIGFDKVVHFSSGIIAIIFAMNLYTSITKSNKIDNLPLFTIFINAVNIGIAVLWEFFEYAMLVFFNNDCIRHYSQGVHDSMTDMLCATIAGVIVTIYMIYCFHKSKETPSIYCVYNTHEN